MSGLACFALFSFILDGLGHVAKNIGLGVFSVGHTRRDIYLEVLSFRLWDCCLSIIGSLVVESNKRMSFYYN
jgi:hypothetical protein